MKVSGLPVADAVVGRASSLRGAGVLTGTGFAAATGVGLAELVEPWLITS
jgi:hypothetical protein